MRQQEEWEREENEQQMGETEDKSGEKGMRYRSERQAFPIRETTCGEEGDSLHRPQAEEGSEGVWHSEELDSGLWSGWGTGIAHKPLLPAEAIMSPLSTRQDERLLLWSRWEGRIKRHLDALMAQELYAGAPMFSAAPIPPEQRCVAHFKGMEQDAHPAGFCRLSAMPLTLFTQLTGATIAHPGRVEQPHTAIGFASLLGLVERFARWTAQGAVWLEGKGISSKATCFPGGGGGGLAIARGGRLLLH